MDQDRIKRSITPALTLARSAPSPISSIISYLLIDIGLSFNQPVGIVSQIRTVNSIIAIMIALLMGVISVKYRPKTLMLSGLLLLAVSALGCFFTPSFFFLFLAYSIAGIGISMIGPMSNTLVSIHLPREKRSSAIGWMMTGMALIGIIDGFVINYLNNLGGWRLAFIGYAFPVALVVFLIVRFWLPGSENITTETQGSDNLLSGYKELLSNKSALSCLLGMTISQTTWQAILLFGTSFYRQVFAIDLGTIIFLNIGYVMCYIVGNIFAGRYINRLGRRRLSVVSLILSGIFMVLFFISPGVWISYVFGLLFAIVGGIRATSTQSHTMEQMQGARGTLMSCMSAAISLGAALGAAIGGYILLVSDYTLFGYVFGVINILGAIVFGFLTNVS